MFGDWSDSSVGGVTGLSLSPWILPAIVVQSAPCNVDELDCRPVAEGIPSGPQPGTVLIWSKAWDKPRP